ncbi:type II toxin-antitoxin system VapC family toxin [Tsukamurella paurometabola]|uniref:Ribonuclease VapC n=1 Tax=Tsukamurella paurometabola TaxID=2061 RepID=A0ABS5NJV9_TSUPA|nr:type II toxin-antitoxin system VapC family toxin [Tsukamurella paurometabola]MBS4103897.1 type II toxin-antitoxin system VapC family toxin [Tsukamurella paurometabola]
MADKLKRVVVDTSVILDFLVPTDKAKADRAEYLLDGHATRHTVVLPAIVVAEVACAREVRAPQGVPQAEAQARAAKALAWIRASNFIVAELSDHTARRAAQLGIDFKLKAPDASILATAEAWGCPHLYSSDSDLVKCDGQLGVKIGAPDDPPQPEPEPAPVPDLFNHGDDE